MKDRIEERLMGFIYFFETVARSKMSNYSFSQRDFL